MKYKNLTSHHQSLELDKVLDSLSNYLSFNLSNNKLKEIELLYNKNKIEYELSLVSEAKKIIDDTNSSIPIENIKDALDIFKSPTTEIDYIIELNKNLKFSRLIKNFISKNENAKNLKVLINNFYTDKDFEDGVFNTFDSELNVVDSASDTLKSLRNSYKDNKDNLKKAIDNLLRNPSFVDNLQDTIVSTREGHPVFQVKASCKNKIQGIVLDVSNSNLTYFIEPISLVPLSNKLRQIEIQIKAEIERIILELFKKFKAIEKEIVSNQKLIVQLDIIFAKAKYAIFLKGVEPEIVEDKIIDIQAMYHPLLIEVKEDIVKNDFILGKTYKSLLITGANTGGKTVSLKCAGLMVLMAQLGMFLPCLGAKIYPFKNVYCDISTEQSLEQGFSTFSAHIKNISDILNKIDENDFILLDELGSGTDPIEGAALGCAIVDFIKSKGALSIITTHLGELKTLKYKDNYFENATVLFDIKTLKPMYKLIVGISGTSNAIDISSQLGLNNTIINKAREILKKENDKDTKLFFEIEKTSQNLIEKEQQTKEALEKIKDTKKDFDEKLQDLKKNKKKSLENFKKKFQNQLEDARSEIKNVIEEIKKEKSLKVALRAYDKINKIENKIREDFSSADDELKEKYKNLDINSLKIGQNVLVKKLSQVVILDSLPDKKGNVTIRIGNIKSKINIKDLAYTDKKIAPHLKKVSVTFDNSDNLLSRLDLRGMRVIDAIDYLDNKLDKASLRGLNQITVIHGIGTGALKSAIKDYLENSPYVSKFRYGDETEGKDGIVIVDLI